jgi:hypothetical protein
VSTDEEVRVQECLRAGLCPICNAGPYKVVASHTLKAHKVTGATLRDMAGLTKSATICSAEASAERRKLTHELMAKGALTVPSGGVKGAKKTFSAAGLAAQKQKAERMKALNRARANAK